MERALSAPPKEPLVIMNNGIPVGMPPNWERFFAVLAGAVKKHQVSTITVAPGSIPANSVKAVAVTCQGAISGQVTTVNRTSVHTGVGIANAWVSGADQITIEFSNLTGAPVDPGNQQLIIHLI